MLNIMAIIVVEEWVDRAILSMTALIGAAIIMIDVLKDTILVMDFIIIYGRLETTPVITGLRVA